MRTHKQEVKRLEGEIQSLYKQLAETCAENEARRLALENNENTFDPVIFHNAVNKLQICVDGLNAIKAVAPSGSESKIIATEVLLQIQE